MIEMLLTFTWLKLLLPFYFLIYLFTAFVWRSYVTWKRTGVNPLVFGKTDSVHDFAGRAFKFTIALSAIAVFLYAFSPTAYSWLAPLTWLQHPTLIIIGVILLAVSLVWTLLAQLQMGNSWRIGIDEQHVTELVQTGVFRLSRNPIFLGMLITLLGVFLVIPNAFTLLVLGLGIVLMQIQIRLEEEYLAKTHGERYSAYCRDVRRWL